MYPVLYQFHAFGRDASIPTYGLFIAIGFAIGSWIAEREARRLGEDSRLVVDACFWALVGGLIGARILFVLTNLPDYADFCLNDTLPRSPWRILLDCTRALHVWEGGLVFYGGFLGALGAVLWIIRRQSASFFRLADTMTPSLALGHLFGRLGCFAAGCCFGRLTTSALGVVFPRSSVAYLELAREGKVALTAAATPALHPTQLYESAAELAIFAALLLLRPRKRFSGQLFLFYLLAYPIARSIIEVYRGDAIRKFVLPNLVSTSQALSALVVAGALLVWHRSLRRGVRR